MTHMLRRTLPALLLSLTLAACDSASTTGDTGDSATVSLTALSCDVDGVNADPFTVADAMAANTAPLDVAGDDTYAAATATRIALNGTTISVTGAGATAAGSTVTVSSAGTYVISGTLADGQVVVDAPGGGLVRLVLDGAAITNADDSAILVAEAGRTAVVLAAGSANTLTDGATYPANAEQNAALWSDDDLAIGGTGALTVTGRFEDGIASKDGLVIRSGTITVAAPDEGIRGKDYLVVRDGALDVTAGGDGLKSDEDGDAALGYVLLAGGAVTVDAAGDAVSAETDALVSGGSTALTSGGGAAVTPGTASTKGLKGGVLVVVDGGRLDIDASDDGLHSNGTVVVNDGNITVATGDDGVHSDGAVTVNGGSLVVSRSYEGVESGTGDLTVNGGVVTITSSDDGINVAGAGDTMPGGPGGGQAGAYAFRVAGGRVTVTAGGDGLDSNGQMAMSGGCVAVNGPTGNGNAAIDYDGSFPITGGVLVAAGSAGMAQAPGSASTQPSVAVRFSQTQAAGTVVSLQSDAGAIVVRPTKAFQTLVVSAPWLARGASVRLYRGGTASGDGVIVDGGTYSGGTLLQTATLSAATTTITS